MTFRSDRAAAIIRQIEEHPETWNQQSFRTVSSCGTAFCFAGWAQAISGRVAMGENKCSMDAMDWLGLDYDQAEYAFNGDRTLDELREFAKTGAIP